jgi:uncharacterized membrane protein YdjX (TVP38/TMEM64 family)
LRVLVSPWGRLALLAVFLVAAACTVMLIGANELLDRQPSGSGSGVWRGVMCVALYALGTLGFVPRPALTIAAGAVFGVGDGLVVAVAGTLLGALLAFAAGRLLGHDAVRPLVLRSGTLTTLDRHLSEWAFIGILVLRLVPVVPFTSVNLGAALSRMPWSPFALATLLGTLPGNTAYVLAGASATTPSPPGLWLPAVACVALLTVVPLWRYVRGARIVAAGSPDLRQLDDHSRAATKPSPDALSLMLWRRPLSPRPDARLRP